MDERSDLSRQALHGNDTVYIHDIESRVFQSIVIRVLNAIEGVFFLEGNLFDHLLGREGTERVKGIYIEQDSTNHSVSIKVELNIGYGISIPEKAQEVQEKISSEIHKLTGLQVSCVHVIFKGVASERTQPSPTLAESEEPINDWHFDEGIEEQPSLEIEEALQE